jgi:hypothetical protein
MSQGLDAEQSENGMAAALRRGAEVREHLKTDEGGSMSAEQVRGLLGWASEAEILEAYKNRELLGWTDTLHSIPTVRFPKWQFTKSSLLPGMDQALRLLGNLEDWNLILFFLNKRGSLADRRPLDLLREGDIEAVKCAACGHIDG